MNTGYETYGLPLSYISTRMDQWIDRIVGFGVVIRQKKFCNNLFTTLNALLGVLWVPEASLAHRGSPMKTSKKNIDRQPRTLSARPYTVCRQITVAA